MNTAFSNPYQNTGRAERPSLFSNSATQAMNEDAFSILSRLEPSRARRKSAWRIAWATPLMALVAVAVVVGLNGGFGKLASSEGSVAGSHSGVESTQAAVGAQPVALASPTAGADGAIVASETFSTAASTHADELASLIAEAERRTSEEQTATAMIAPVVAASGTIAGGGNPGETKPSVAAGRAKAQASPPKRATATPAKAHARSVTKDKDVELIGALLAHVAAPATAQAPKTPARKQQAVAAAPARTAARRDRGTPNERDAARHAAGVPTESLVKQCRSLGILEGELCRLRVCSDLWGKDPACPSSVLTASDS